MLDSLTVDSFTPHLRSVFRIVVAEEQALDATLAAAEALGLRSPHATRAPFRLLFHGPKQPVLPQRIYRLEHVALGAFDLFVVPIGPGGDCMQYEAIFT